MAGVWDKINCFVEELLNLSRKIDKNGVFHEANFSKKISTITQKAPPCGFNFFHLPGNFGPVNLLVNLPAANPNRKWGCSFTSKLVNLDFLPIY